MIKVLSFLSNENCFAGHGLSTTALNEQQYLVWDIAYRSTKRQDTLEIWRLWPFWPHPGYAYVAKIK